VSYASSSRTATLIPTVALSDTTSYTARLTGAIVDGAATPLAATEWSFKTVRKRPRVTLTVISQNSRFVRFALQSADRDRLRFAARLVSGGRTLARRSGAVGPGLSRLTRLAARGRGRARLVVEVHDPQSNGKRIVRTLRLRR
jgi:hypothetical protein